MRICFVCHGNICRSPMAEYIFAHLAKQAGLSDGLVIVSRATSAEELGNDIYPPARAMLNKKGIPCSRRAATQLRREDYGRYDLFLGMDAYNVRNMRRIFGDDPDGKIGLLTDYSGGGEVADPWYSGDFATAYQDIFAGCQGLLDTLTRKSRA